LMNIAIEDRYIAPSRMSADTIVIEFVRALARRQARMDSELSDEPRTLH
jgi:hypothetical protein